MESSWQLSRIRSGSFIIGIILSLVTSIVCQEKEFIQIETNKILCVLNFLETTKGGLSVSSSYASLIDSTYGKDSNFINLVNRYHDIYMSDHFSRNGLPQDRHGHKSIKDLLWIASSNSKNIEDFSERIIGYLPHSSHVDLIDIMHQIEPYYDDLVWDKTQDQITRIENQLEPYRDDISDLFKRISVFYGTDWDTLVPFKVMLYPIPLGSGNTTAIPKGNTLICAFLADNEEDYMGRLGIIIHEMCHILYDEQSVALQNELSGYFSNLNSDYKSLASTYINEGMATVLGNGWAYKQIHGELDTATWYNDEYIDGYAHALYDLTDRYMRQGSRIDSNYVSEAIISFGNTFPESTKNVRVLMTNINVYANMDDGNVQSMVDKISAYFPLRGMSFATPADDAQAADSYYDIGQTKLFLFRLDHEAGLNLIKKKFSATSVDSAEKSFLYSFFDEKTMSNIIVINAHSEAEIDLALKKLSEQEHIILDSVIPIHK